MGLLFLLQLNQNLNDVLVSLEKQHGSNTFTVKAQPRYVMLPGRAVGHVVWGRTRSCGPCWLVLSGSASLCSEEQRAFRTGRRPGQSADPWPSWLPVCGAALLAGPRSK